MLPCGSFLRISMAFVLILSHAHTAFTFSLTFFDFAFARYRILGGFCSLKAGPPALNFVLSDNVGGVKHIFKRTAPPNASRETIQYSRATIVQWP
jgi:hypothetical protein